MTKLGENVTCCTTSAAQRSSRMTQSDSKTRSTTCTLKSGTKPAHHGKIGYLNSRNPRSKDIGSLHIVASYKARELILDLIFLNLCKDQECQFVLWLLIVICTVKCISMTTTSTCIYDVWSLKDNQHHCFYFIFLFLLQLLHTPCFVLLRLFGANMYMIKGYIHLLVSFPFVGKHSTWYFVQCTVDISLQ